MKIITRSSKYAVIDEILPQDSFEKVWLAAQYEGYNSPHANSWSKVWRLNDGICLGSNSYSLKQKPFNNYMDAVSQCMLIAGKYVPEIVGEEGKDWDDITLRTYLYPKGTKLSWHNDARYYHCAMTYYIHPYWASTWGGELMVAQVPNDFPEQPKAGPHLDHCWEDSFIGHFGMGQWISPKPNRLVIMLGGTYHAINRVDDDAGDHTRAAIVSFFVKEEKSE